MLVLFTDHIFTGNRRRNPDFGMDNCPIDSGAFVGKNTTIQTIGGAALFLGDLMPQAHDRLLTANELAEIFQVSRDEIYRLAKRGVIPAYKIGGVWRFELPQVKKRIRQQMERDNGFDS